MPRRAVAPAGPGLGAGLCAAAHGVPALPARPIKDAGRNHRDRVHGDDRRPSRHGPTGVFAFIVGAMVGVFIIIIGGFGPAVTRRRLEAIAA